MVTTWIKRNTQPYLINLNKSPQANRRIKINKQKQCIVSPSLRSNKCHHSLWSKAWKQVSRRFIQNTSSIYFKLPSKYKISGSWIYVQAGIKAWPIEALEQNPFQFRWPWCFNQKKSSWFAVPNMQLRKCFKDSGSASGLFVE